MRKTERSVEQKDTDLLLLRLSSLPVEISLPIIMELEPKQLLAICNVATKSKSKRLKSLGYFCDDANFWRDYLLNKGYDLPETLPKSVSVLREEEESDASILKSIFFDKPFTKYELEKSLHQLVKRYYEGKAEYEDISMADLQQTILDLDYLEQQIGDRNARQRDKRPRVYRILIKVPIKAENWLDRFPKKLTLDEFFEFLVEKDLSNTELNLGERHSNIIDSLASNLGFNSATYAKRLHGDLDQAINEQHLLLLDKVIQEGDLIEINFQLSSGSLFFPRKVDYYVGKNKQLHKIENPERYSFFFPEAANSFLADNDISDYTSAKELYPFLMDYDISGYTEGGKQYRFLGRPKNK